MDPEPSTATEWRTEPGLLAYPTAMATMRARAAAIRAGTAPPLIWLVEHPPLYTSGTSARPDELTDPTRFPTYEAGRGGQWTYHGPGQRTVYVLLDLQSPPPALPPKDIRAYVRLLEQWMIETLATFAIQAERREGRIGIWVTAPNGEESKIGAIGVRLTRWVSWHGMALNVAPDLSHFTGIIPCGIRTHGVTSLRAQGSPATMPEVDAALRTTWHRLSTETHAT